MQVPDFPERTIPAFYALLLDKEKETYRQLWLALQSKATEMKLQLKPDVVQFDFEPGNTPLL